MARTPRTARQQRHARRIAHAGASAALAGALALALPASAILAQDEPSPSPTVREVPLDKPTRPVRVRVPYAEIDLPVVSSERKVAGNPFGYPLCDVAQYLLSKEQKLVLPGQPGTAWLLGHAQPGMFLPLVEIWQESGSKGLMGKLVKLQLRDGRLMTYRISQVRVAHDYDIAERPSKRQQRLVLQTSTGPTGDYPKLMIAARLIDAQWTDEPRPDPEPRACWQPTPKPTPKGKKNRKKRPTPEPAEIIEPSEPLDATTLVLGSGAVLLGATVVAVYLARRP